MPRIVAFLSFAFFRTIKIGLAMLAFAISLGAAYAQNVIPVDVKSPTDTALGVVLKLALTGFVGVCIWLGVRLAKFLAAKTEQSQAGTLSAAGWSLTNRVWLKAQAIAAKLFSRERALVEKILSDGQVTPEEFSELKQKVLADLMEVVTQEVPLFGSLLGLVGDRNIAGFLEGVAAKVTHNILTGAVPAPVPAPDPVPG